MTDEEKAELGNKFAIILMLKEDHWKSTKENLYYKTAHGSKSCIGIYNLIVNLGRTAETGRFT